MSQLLGIKFRPPGQIYHFWSGPFVLARGDCVIVETEQGFGLGSVVIIEPADQAGTPAPEGVKAIYRKATAEDIQQHEGNEQLGRDARQFCRTCINERHLDMKLVDVEVFFDRSKIIFFFTAPNRIDFRELVKDLVKNYRTRIELRQIGVRHETQMIGAIGNCGMVCCCRRFLRRFAPVTIKMAKEQNLFLNPSKISGICGRLLCCLSYEQDNYEDFHRNCPKIGKKYQTSAGGMRVLRANLFRRSISVLTETGEEKELTLEEWDQSNPCRPDPTVPRDETPAPGKAGPQSESQPRESVPARVPSAPPAPARQPAPEPDGPTAPEHLEAEAEANEESAPASGTPEGDSAQADRKGGQRRRRKRKPKSRKSGENQ